MPGKGDKKVNLLEFQRVFGKIPRKRVELMKCPTKEDSRGRNKRCPELARRARGECTEANCVMLGEKFEKLYRRQKRTERAFAIATGQKSEKDDPLLHPKGIPWKDRKTLRNINPSYKYRTRDRKKIQEQLVKSGMNKMPRLSRKKVKRRYNKEVVVLETKDGCCSTVGVLKDVWQAKLKKGSSKFKYLIDFRIMNAQIQNYGPLKPVKETIVLVTKEGAFRDEKESKRWWKKRLKEIAPNYRLKIAKVYKGKGKLK